MITNGIAMRNAKTGPTSASSRFALPSESAMTCGCVFPTLRHARHLIAAWRDAYNHHRKHFSRDGLTPREYH